MKRNTNVFNHLRANLALLVLTLLLCSVLYPLALLGFGQLVFPAKVSGSLVPDGEGHTVGSLLVAQEFKGDEWFQPRPSAASYNAAASGGSNWAANNPRLRDRVARQLGPIVKYASGPKVGQLVGPDIERWFAERPDRTAKWAKDYPTLAAAWVTSDDLAREFVIRWVEAHPDVLAVWRHGNPNKVYDPAKPEELAVLFFASYASAHSGSLPSIVEVKTPSVKAEKQVQPVRDGADIRSTFFESWLQQHPRAELEKVPADMVMASGSGLDPHITLRNARYQLDRVVAARSEKSGAAPSRVRTAVETVLARHAFTPLAGLVGEPLVNVLEVNLALQAGMTDLAWR